MGLEGAVHEMHGHISAIARLIAVRLLARLRTRAPAKNRVNELESPLREHHYCVGGRRASEQNSHRDCQKTNRDGLDHIFFRSVSIRNDKIEKRSRKQYNDCSKHSHAEH